MVETADRNVVGKEVCLIGTGCTVVPNLRLRVTHMQDNLELVFR